MKFLIFIPLVLLSWGNTCLAQEHNYQLFLSGNGNLHIPRNTSTKGVYPVFRIDKDSNSKMRLGGVGIGASWLQNYSPKVVLK